MTFSLLPIQLIPSFQYTVSSVMGTLLFGFRCWQIGRRGFWGASVEVDPDSEVTPWLIACWLAVVVRGLRRAHRVLGRFYDLGEIRTSYQRVGAWEEVAGYVIAFGWDPEMSWASPLFALLRRYSQATTQFLFGTTSQQRASTRQ